MGTQVTLDPGLGGDGPEILIVSAEAHGGIAPALFLAHGFLIVDGYDWHCKASLLRKSLIPERRNFKEPYGPDHLSQELRVEYKAMCDRAEGLFGHLYTKHNKRFQSVCRRSSWRPMITGPEPLHFDSSSKVSTPLVTAYINVSMMPRVYHLSYTFPGVLRVAPEIVKQAYAERATKNDDASYSLRIRGEKGLPPFGPDAPRHKVELAPWSIWFFDAKTVSHEVVYGEGAIGVSFEVPDCDAITQHDYMAAA